jgi:CubicO group peptidase (beta-lactamase class C family)
VADTQRQTGQGPGAGLMTGNVSPGFESVRSLFQRYLESDPFYSAQLSVYHRGEQVVDLCGGPHLALDSVTGLFSASKGLAGIAFATLIEEGLIELDRSVAHYWPEFGVKGKGRIEVRQLLSHSAGLLGVDGGFLDQEVLESSPAAARIAAEHPIWRPGTALGYHGLTIGLFLEELTRRVTGGSLQELYESRIRAPRGIDAYLGLPESEEKRFVVVGPLRVVGGPAAGPAPSPDGLAGFAFNNVNNPVPLEQIYLSPNTRAVRAAGPASLGGVGSARGVARAYATLLGHVGDPVLSGETIAAISQQQAWGRDRVLDRIASYAIVFGTPHPEFEFASYRGFGHSGASGSLGLADPLYDMALGYVPNPMQNHDGPADKAVQLSLAARQAIAHRLT